MTRFLNFAPLGLVVVSLAACRSAPPVTSTTASAEPTTTPDRATQELDILEAVFRHQFEHNASSATAQRRVECLFLSLHKDHDPPTELLARFKDHTPPVEPVSAAAPERWYGIRHKQNGRHGIIVLVDRIRWIDADTVEVEGGYYEGSTSASGNVYRVERRDGTWAVVDDRMNWIS